MYWAVECGVWVIILSDLTLGYIGLGNFILVYIFHNCPTIGLNTMGNLVVGNFNQGNGPSLWDPAYLGVF